MDILNKLNLEEVPITELRSRKKYCVIIEKPIDKEPMYTMELKIWDVRQILEFLVGIPLKEIYRKIKTSLTGNITIIQIIENIQLYNGSEGKTIKAYNFFEKK